MLPPDRGAPDGVYKLVRRYALSLGFKIGAHALRATAARDSDAISWRTTKEKEMPP